MAWVVKELRVEALEELRRDAQRDARRTRRRADRAAAEVAAALDELAELATELRATVRRQRMAACPPSPRSEGPSTAGPHVVTTPPPPDTAPLPRRAVRRDGRASLHASPLLELFRATGPAG
jgi:hypothetical protein